VKIRAVLTTGAAMATVAAVAFAGPALTRGPAAHSLSAAAATRAAMTSSSIAVPGMQIHVVNLHQQFSRALASKRVVTGPEAGIVPMMTGRGTAAPAFPRLLFRSVAFRYRMLPGRAFYRWAFPVCPVFPAAGRFLPC